MYAITLFRYSELNVKPTDKIAILGRLESN